LSKAALFCRTHELTPIECNVTDFIVKIARLWHKTDTRKRCNK